LSSSDCEKRSLAVSRHWRLHARCVNIADGRLEQVFALVRVYETINRLPALPVAASSTVNHDAMDCFGSHSARLLSFIVYYFRQSLNSARLVADSLPLHV